jgi:hypothetical protein
MMIPADVLPNHHGEGESKGSAESTRTVPVESSAGLRSTLSQAFYMHHDPIGIRGKPTHAWRAGFYPGEERRQHERRRQNLPALLDTRLQDRRKASGGYLSVNFNI